MRNTLLALTFAFICGALILLFSQTAGVAAIGAATDNTTQPDVPTSDQTHDEIKPPVKYVLHRPTSQPETAPPSYILDFIGTWDGDKFKVTADETWYLDVDINAPGWLYIYEYFPADSSLQGRWIAYKWQLPQSGVWRLGPFSAANDEPEGQHIYRIWFYSDGQWAAEDPELPQSNLAYWTYSKGQLAEQIPQQPPTAPDKEVKGFGSVIEFITRPVVLAIIAFLLVATVVAGLYLTRVYSSWGKGQGTVSLYPEIWPGAASTMQSTASASAKIVLPNGMELKLAGDSRVIGRGDLARALNLDGLSLISRRHFEIKSENEQFFIQDLDSPNGVKLNGDSINGKGLVSLNNNDIIEVAGVIELTFQLP